MSNNKNDRREEKQKEPKRTNALLEKLRKGTPLRTRIFITLQMGDKANWKNGEYLGDMKKLIEETNYLIHRMESFYKDGMPEGFKKIEEGDHLSTSTGLVSI